MCVEVKGGRILGSVTETRESEDREGKGKEGTGMANIKIIQKFLELANYY